jgi:hypothetical protein
MIKNMVHKIEERVFVNILIRFAVYYTSFTQNFRNEDGDRNFFVYIKAVGKRLADLYGMPPQKPKHFIGVYFLNIYLFYVVEMFYPCYV